MITQLPAISAFVPAFNEAANIEKVIVDLHRALDRVAQVHEVIVVLYEGCSDGTDRILQRLQQADERLHLVLQPRERRGYGVALRMGIQASRHEYVFYTDADDQFDPQELDRLVPLMEQCDLAMGYRVRRQDPLARRITARVYNLLVDAALDTGVRDVDCAFKLFRRAVFDVVQLTCDTGLIDPQMVAGARRAGFRVAQVGVTHRPRGGGAGHFEAEGRLGLPSPSVVLGVLRELWTVRRGMR